MREFLPPHQKSAQTELSEKEKLENYFTAINTLPPEQRAMKIRQLGRKNLQRMIGEEAIMPLVHETVNLVNMTELSPVISELSDLAKARVMYCLKKKNGEVDETSMTVQENPDVCELQNLEDLLKKSGRITELIEIYLEIVKKGDLTVAKKVSDLKNFKTVFKTVPDELNYEFSIATGKEAVKQENAEAFFAVHGALFKAYVKGYRKQEVKEIIDGIISLGNAKVANNFATILYTVKGDVAEAIHYLETALKMGHSKALINMAIIMRAIGDFNLAEKYFLDAIKTGDKQIISKGARGLIDLYVQFGRLERIEGLNDIFAKVGAGIKEEALPELRKEAAKNIMLINKYSPASGKKSVTN